ncbi:MAG: 3-methyladenine DNA glycosylase [Gammaproteobacteria bacterium 39-13]|mgnify:CR=1 FL=1|nr:DNA-3-methyladenine glycosylase [Gammaproteobacteria bacterium]OJV93099.1 MAG: 3-methyladenine DNA glycosylase [Gammaproteobacteria bacterium 39-13]
MSARILPRSYYLSEDVLALSKDLLGKVLVTSFNHEVTAGIIVETEAYHGAQDKASHAYNNRRTSRTETMYAEGGVAYIYLCYGLHHLFNIVTGPKNIPHAVLVRAIEPVDGIPTMLKRRMLKGISHRLTGGPGILSQALGITKRNDGSLLTNEPIWIEDRKIVVSKKDIIASCRVGIDYAEEHRDLPWRFRLRNSPWTSKA